MSETVVTPAILLALPITRNNQHQYEFHGATAYAGGSKCAPVRGRLIPFDLIYISMPLALASGACTAAIAAAAVRERHALIRDLATDVEDANAWEEPPHPDAQFFFVVGLKRDGETVAAGGQIDKALAEIAAEASFDQLAALCPLSINQLLKSVRESAAKAGLTLPPRFTTPREHPDYPKWIASIEERRRLADERWAAAQARRGRRQRHI